MYIHIYLYIYGYLYVYLYVYVHTYRNCKIVISSYQLVSNMEDDFAGRGE
jgi:hypothetical protein